MNIDIKMTINLDGEKKIELTETEARALYNKLKDLFGNDGNDHYIPYPIYPTYPNTPWITWTSDNTGDPPPEQPYTITSSQNPSKYGYTGDSASGMKASGM